jgi:hypothetical protein
MILSLAFITREINRRAKAHLIGHLQEFRKTAKGLTRLATGDIFGPQTTFGRYAFHVGGRKELQFNVAYEGEGKYRRFRHGVAFSFRKGHSLPEPSVLLPKVKRFNKFLTATPGAFADMKMWTWRKEHGENECSKNKAPTTIEWNRTLFLQQNPFIFLGRRTLPDEIDFETILSDFDRLLPLYEYVERGTHLIKEDESFNDVGGFRFEPRDIHKQTEAVTAITAKHVKIQLRENKLQEALRDHLSSKLGRKNVSREQRISTMRGYLYKTDVMVRHGKTYWIYEAKIASSARECIRKALGQLLEYSYWPGHQKATKLIVVGEPPLSAQSAEYLNRLRKEFSLPIEYKQFDMSKGKLI